MGRTGTVSWARLAPLFVVGGLALLSSQACMAEGALAIGIPAGGAVKGFAGGHALNVPDMQKARDGALDGCHKSIGASDAAKKACGVVATFKNQCYAIALDPKDGTPGIGWGIAESQQLAVSQALQQCRNTAGADRAQFCTVPERNRGCDGNAK